jgi:hypothetical protein
MIRANHCRNLELLIDSYFLKSRRHTSYDN